VALALYDVSIPVLTRGLAQLRHYLAKGADHAAKEGYDPAVLLQMRLYPDMFPLVKQVQIASDMTKNGCARLAGIEPPKWEDKEATLDELVTRADRTSQFISGISAEQINPGATREIVLPMRNRTMRFATGWDYLSTFVIPNFYFHCTTTYDLLRHCGVKIGKSDFIGQVGET
jgi:hypothetical protein